MISQIQFDQNSNDFTNFLQIIKIDIFDDSSFYTKLNQNSFNYELINNSFVLFVSFIYRIFDEFQKTSIVSNSNQSSF